MIILALIILDGFLILISIFYWRMSHVSMAIITFDLVTSIILAIGYLFRLKHRVINWNVLIVSIPFYFIGVYGLEPASLVFKPLNLLKVFGLFFCHEGTSDSVNKFVKKSRLWFE